MEARHYRLNLNNKILMLFIVKYYENNVFSLKNNTIENCLVVVRCFMLLFLCAFYVSRIIA